MASAAETNNDENEMPAAFKRRSVEPSQLLSYRFLLKIKKNSYLSKNEEAVDKISLHCMQDLEEVHLGILNQIYKHKKAILRQMNGWITPVAQNILQRVLFNVDSLKNRIEMHKKGLNEISALEEKEDILAWIRLCGQCRDRKGLVAEILAAIAEKSKRLIDRDIQVVKEYQLNSLAQLPEESEEFNELEKRLSYVIQEPLMQLKILRDKVIPEKLEAVSTASPKLLAKFYSHHWSKKRIRQYLRSSNQGILAILKAKLFRLFGWQEYQTSLQEVSLWSLKLQETREKCFEKVLKKIDHVMKDVVYKQEREELTIFFEDEGELQFIKRELDEIDLALTNIRFLGGVDKEFLLARLEGISEHLTELEQTIIPLQGRMEIEMLKSRVNVALDLF